MSMKQCPYCGKDIPSEAVLCKFCHNLLIDEAGNMEDASDDRTRVFKKQEIEDEEGKTRRFKVPDNYIEDGDDYAPRPRRQQPQFRNEDYDDYDDFEEYYDENEDSRKKMFIFVAFITVGLLIVVIAAVIVAMKLFGGGSNNNNQNNSVPAAPPAQTQVQQQETAPAETTAPPVDTTTAEPDVTLLLPEESSAADSVIILEPDSEEETTVSEASLDSESSAADESVGENFVVGGGSSSTASPATSTTDSAASDSSNSPQLSGGDYEETIYNAIKDRLDGELTSSQFREDDGYTVYYYFFTDGGAHGYSVAYDKTTGEVVLDQNY